MQRCQRAADDARVGLERALHEGMAGSTQLQGRQMLKRVSQCTIECCDNAVRARPGPAPAAAGRRPGAGGR